MTVELPADVMESARISAEEVRLEIAVALFRVERLSLGRAAELAGLSVQTFQEINAPASRLKKSCRGLKSILRSWSSHPVSVFGVCRWKRSELSGRGLNGKTAWERVLDHV